MPAHATATDRLLHSGRAGENKPNQPEFAESLIRYPHTQTDHLMKADRKLPAGTIRAAASTIPLTKTNHTPPGKELLSPPLLKALFRSVDRPLYRARTFLPIILLKLSLSFAAVFVTTTAGANFYDRSVSISGKDISPSTVFREIQQQSGYNVFVEHEVKLKLVPVSLSLKNATAAEVLNEFLKQQPIDLALRLEGTTFTLYKKKEEVIQSNENGKHELRGYILGDAGVPLAGATVAIKNLSVQTATNDKGEFSFESVPPGIHKLLFSYVGYYSSEKEISVSGNVTRITTELKISLNNLDETVIKGYYKTSKKLNTGDVSVVKASDIEKQPVSNFLLAMEGRVPGAEITQSTGVPGRQVNINIRGINTIGNGSNPLYIIDGVPFYTGNQGTQSFDDFSVATATGIESNPFNVLNPLDIESIQVLKDADATALYGSRGANGVIIVTTKKGRPGETKVDGSFYMGGGKVTFMPKLLDAKQYLKMRHEAYQNDGVTNYPFFAYDLNGKWDTTHTTDWQKFFIGNVASYLDAQVNVSGGNAYTQFLLGLGYHREGTVFPGDFSDLKPTMHLNLNHSSVNNKLHLVLSAYFSEERSRLPLRDLTPLTMLAPVAPPMFDSFGRLNWQNNTWSNPAAYLRQIQKSTTDFVSTNLNFSFEVLKGLTLRLNSGINYNQLTQTTLIPGSSLNPALQNPSSSVLADNNYKAWTLEPQATYSKRISKGTLDMMLGSSFLSQTVQGKSISGIGYSDDALLENPLSASQIRLNGVNYSLYKYSAILARVGFSWENKYIVNFTGNRDGSSRFGPGKQFSDFGSIGGAWIFTNERFVNSFARWLSYGKIKGSYGITGNDQIGDYNFYNLYSPIGGNATYLGGSLLSTTRLPNINYSWERNNKLQFGLELATMHDRILLSLNYYRNRSSNLLVGYPLPGITGNSTVIANLPAVIQNKGWEILLNADIIKKEKFTWSASFNMSVPQSRLMAFPGIENTSYNSRYVVGQPLSITQVYHYTGIDQSKGSYTFQDFNKDGKISMPEDNKSVVFTGQKFYGALVNSFKYKSIELEIVLQFVSRPHGIADASLKGSGRPGFSATNSNQLESVYNNIWRGPSTPNAYVQYLTTRNSSLITAINNMNNSDGVYMDASFLRCKNLTLSYWIPINSFKLTFIKSAQIFMQSQNLFTLTKYKNFDPEGLNQYSFLPPLRVVTGGLRVAF